MRMQRNSEELISQAGYYGAETRVIVINCEHQFYETYGVLWETDWGAEETGKCGILNMGHQANQPGSAGHN